MKAKSEPFSKTEWILLITAVALAVFLVTSVLKDSTAQTPITIITDAPQTTHTQSYE
ncbi:MAG: hypothetical protein GX851_04830, partial [Clostridiales bacterium]|nr:hypothetical protein [Clostridiales bacterium]